MADRHRKEATPPPLLLIPASGGLTLNPPEQPNILMPVVQSEPSLLCPDEAEADSFVGQNLSEPNSTTSSQSASPFSMFQQSSPTGLDPFAQVGHRPPPVSMQPAIQLKSDVSSPQQSPFSPQLQQQTHTPQSQHQTPLSTTPSLQQPQQISLPPTSQVVSTPPQLACMNPVQNSTVTPGGPPPVGPPPSSSGSTPNRYRQKGPLRYAPPPVDSFPMIGSPHPGSVGPSPSSPQVPVSTSLPPSIPSVSDTNPGGQFQTSPVPPTSSYPTNTVSGLYQPVQAHWCFCKRIENREVWFPFSIADSLRLEGAFQRGCLEPEVVATDGGRYDVSISQRIRTAVYWDEEPTHVRRSTWFYKREGDNKYVPYTEAFAQKLEEEYKNAVLNNVWHKRLEFPGGETIVMHNPNVIVHFQASSQPDEWGTVHLSPSNHESLYQSIQGDQMRPRVVKRGIDDFATVLDGETGQIDHLVFVVHGIGAVCDIRFRSIVECVDDFRSISQTLLHSHFSDAIKSGRIGRVEFLPVHWHTTLHGDATGIDSRLKAITLPSTGKLRHFVNDTLLDILFYTSPKYCQTMCDTVGSEINRLYKLFLKRNPTFRGSLSVAGHSLGSSILFDLLLHQHDPLSSPDTASSENKVKESTPEISAVENMELPPPEKSTEDQQPDMTLEELLARVGLQDKLKIFEQEQMDMDSLTMCSDADLKDLGLPMGPRKKLQMLLREEQQKRILKKQEAEMKAKLEMEKNAKEAEEVKKKMLEAEKLDTEKLQMRQTSVSVDYLMGVAGTGQPSVEYPQLLFQPTSFFAFGSPIGVFLAVRGVENVGEEFHLPTCPRMFNIFHPGRSKCRSHTNFSTMIEQEKKRNVDDVISQLTIAEDERAETGSIASSHDEEINMGQLNEGRRVDYVLQEKPIESFNDYLFALASHGCYWESEDTVLLVLKELYSLNGVKPQMPWPDSQAVRGPLPTTPSNVGISMNMQTPSQGPPLLSFPSQIPPTSGYIPASTPSSMPSPVTPTAGFLSSVGSPTRMPSLSHSPVTTNIGPPPLTGFVKSGK
ncbi:SEC23-interacting protein,Phospholipase DDHD2 [Acanthosepion pharaonis]|uniref:SEC23-interacting protein,Phospholipase DDHD2 n=1 Tax=Acanthosepion pharaonis TaxID=158019 RepID=A0A812D387_ACAPH|nr:SEC23-interacting protein,Phospholipase DDHD2 [Sepia pharaonis]